MSCISIGLLICMFTAVCLATLYRDPDSTTASVYHTSFRRLYRLLTTSAVWCAGVGNDCRSLNYLDSTTLQGHPTTQFPQPMYMHTGHSKQRILVFIEWSLTESVLEPGQGAGEELGALLDTAVNFIKDHFVEVLATKGWADAVEDLPREVIKVTLLLAGRMAKNGAPATTEAGTTEAVTTEAGTTASTQPHSQTPAAAAPPLAACPTAPPDEDTVSRLRSLSGEDRDSRLIQAAKEGAVGALRALLAAGADVVARDQYGETGLHQAAIRGRAEAASCLLGAGAQVDARGRRQETPLHLAAYVGHAAVARLLLAASADPNARDDWGKTPLHRAAWFGRAELAAALLEAGADRRARDNMGRTPLDIARSYNKQHLFEMLTQR